MNLLILTVYNICVAYVFYKAFEVLDSLVAIQPDVETINKQLKEQKIEDLIGISFKFEDGYELDKLDDLKNLEIKIKNKSLERLIEVDWNQSSLTDFSSSAGRVIRIIPDLKEVPQSQTYTTLLPGQSVEEKLSDEKLKSPLCDAKKLKAAALQESRFYLQIILRISDPTTKAGKSYRLRCPFIAKKLSWKKAVALVWK